MLRGGLKSFDAFLEFEVGLVQVLVVMVIFEPLNEGKVGEVGGETRLSRDETFELPQLRSFFI